MSESQNSGSDQGADRDANSEFLFSGATYLGDTHRLARLLVPDLEEREVWSVSEMGAMLKHQLAVPLELELKTNEMSGADAASIPSGMTFREALFGDGATLTVLRHIKDYAKWHLLRKDRILPPELVRVIYYGSVANARRRFGDRITSLADSDCRTGIEWVSKQEWVESEVRQWFQEEAGRW